MKAGRPSDSSWSFKLGGMTINAKNIWGKPMAFVLLAFVIGATVSQGSFAFADDSATNPFRAIWDAIGELQIKTESLQAQIDDLKAQQGTVVSAAQTVTKNSEASLGIDVTAGQSGQTLVTFIVRNAGPDSAVGVKLTAFYQTSLFQINFIQGAECSDGSRGIIECYLGTIVAGSETRIVADATPISLGQQAIITADLSSITDDANLTNNHAESVFITSSAPVVQPQAPVLQPQAETIQADKFEYAAGETVTITGNVGSVNTVQQAQIQVSFTDGTLYSSEQVAVSPDGSYQYQFSIPADTSDLGMYRVFASYDGRTIEVLFSVVAAQAPEAPAEQPQEEQPAEEQPTEEQPSEEAPSEEQPQEEQPAEEQPAEQPQEGEQPSEQGAEEGSAEQSGGESTGEQGEGTGDESTGDVGGSDTGSGDAGSGDTGGSGSDDGSSGDESSSSDGGSSGDSGSEGGSSGEESGSTG